jgi:hypothetical protein
MKIRAIGLVAALLLTSAAAKPPKSELTISTVIDNGGGAVSALLTCGPKAGGGHPQPARACKALKKAGGDPGKLTGPNTICTMEYVGVTATIKGTWRGETVDWTQRYGNTCQMVSAKGVVLELL